MPFAHEKPAPSPYINRFLQPDSIIPSPANPQSFNRFSYVYNRPINFTDPSGHDPYWCWDDDGNVNDSCLYNQLEGRNESSTRGADSLFEKYGVSVDTLTREQKRSTMGAIYAIGKKLAEVRGSGETAADAFSAEFSPVAVVFDPGCINCRNSTACGSQMSGTVNYNGGVVNCTPGGAYSPFPGDQITIASLPRWSVLTMVHEFGHIYDHQHGDQPRISMMSTQLAANRNSFLRANPCDGCLLWQQHPPSNYADAYSEGEVFGELFIAWVYGVWNTDSANIYYVEAAQNWMNPLMHP
jgi:hypothetical protein